MALEYTTKILQLKKDSDEIISTVFNNDIEL